MDLTDPKRPIMPNPENVFMGEHWDRSRLDTLRRVRVSATSTLPLFTVDLALGPSEHLTRKERSRDARRDLLHRAGPSRLAPAGGTHSGCRLARGLKGIPPTYAVPIAEKATPAEADAIVDALSGGPTALRRLARSGSRFAVVLLALATWLERPSRSNGEEGEACAISERPGQRSHPPDRLEPNTCLCAPNGPPTSAFTTESVRFACN